VSEQTQKARQTYLDNIKAKTGKSAQQLAVIARAKGLTKARAVTDWLKEEFDLGYGHAGMVWYLMAHEEGPKTPDDRLAKLFSGKKERWLEPYRKLEAQILEFGPDVQTYANTTYVNLLRDGKKFGIVQPSGERLDVGIKLKGVEANGRFEAAEKWNAMVTHRVQIADPKALDAEVLKWLKQAYAALK
jgi:hypothetical protein